MSIDVILVVLVGALLHASWNVIVKSGTDKSLSAAMISLGGCVCALPFLSFVPLPSAASIPYILVSAAFQFAYFQLVAAAYRAGEIGLVYPIMRGVAPLLVAMASGFLLDESLSIAAICGILTISIGVLALAFDARGGGSGRAVLLALANAGVIASYTFVDGVGARLSGNPISYTLWMALLPPMLLFAWAIRQRGAALVTEHLRTNWKSGLLGGGGSLVSYGLALWAMTKAPVATVAALRETSILFAILISIFILKERVSAGRCAAAGLIAAGVMIMRLG